MTKELIEITFGNALAQAKELETCADSMENLVRGSLSSIQSEMALSWQGENANAYFQKVNLTGNNILKTAGLLRFFERQKSRRWTLPSGAHIIHNYPDFRLIKCIVQF